MAVGADEYTTPIDQAIQRGTYVAGAALALGLVTGSRTVRGLAGGALLALLGVRAAAKRRASPTAN
jgi:hypothetical protein